ncbi:MAG: alpha/beta hydrolase [Succiniclasticum sp.]|nr:alpha/beta hydrolase [Succiniclasticum sp.]
MLRFAYDQISKKRLLALILAGLVWAGGKAMAMPVEVDSATKGMPGRVESVLLSVPVRTPVINQISGVVYEQVPMRGYPSVPMKMDILQPKSETKLPAVVYVTGGGFINANKDNGIQLRMHLAEAGYVVASIQYRVAPTARFPEPLEDVKSAIRYLKAHADQFGVDPERVGIIGGSAGGYLTAMAATTSGTTTFDKGENLQVGERRQGSRGPFWTFRSYPHRRRLQ